jgi:RNA polymerase sigma-70 factor (ECF subfamily)
MAEPEGPEGLRDELRTAWQRYVDLLAPLRPALHAYCRRLAGSVWDAEDLVQDTLLRAFGHLGFVHHEIRNPRAYLLRTATNVWIDGLRRRERPASEELPEPVAPAGAAPDAIADVRDAGSRLLQRLSPQERAALLLKELFELSLEEIAAILTTTTGAVKAALHRGRERLREPEGGLASRRPLPSAELVDRFIERYYARDVEGLVALMLDGGSTENVGSSLGFGRESLEGTEHFLYKVVHGHPEWPAAFQPEAVRLERGEYEGEPLVLCFATRRGREALEQVLRLEEVDGRVARLRGYAFCPETMREVGAALGLPVRTGLYRFPTPAPGQYWRPPGEGSPRGSHP